MTQEDLVRLYFANGESHSTWTYCFNQQCPLAQQCARYLSVTYKDPGIFATSKKSSCRFHLEAHDSCETTLKLKNKKIL